MAKSIRPSIVLIGGATVIALVLIALFHGKMRTTATSSATYTAAISSTDVVNPATINVIVDVKNTGSSSGTPDCTVHLTEPGGAYTGFDIFTLRPLAAGESMSFNGNIVVTHEGASYVSAYDSSVTCS